MINRNAEMIRIAMSYLNIDLTAKNTLCNFYNENCGVLVANPKRKYKIKYTDNWCAMFMSVCAFKAGLVSFDHEVSVIQMRDIAISKDKFLNDGEFVCTGDMIVYNWNADYVPDHIGLIISISDNHYVVVEGNYSSTVKVRIVKKDSKFIAGFIKL